MKLTNLPFALLLLVCGCTLRSMAQQDTSHLDIGYLTLKKEFTQQISIKGSDLEQMPFFNLSDAIGAWLYGAYSTSATLQYVVDGNPVTDVNAYSIHDIDEVILVQHAAGLIATAPGQAELVLIRTKRRAGPGGITGAAQAGLVTANGYGYNTVTSLFHNYYLSGYRNVGKVSYGVSANFIRDVLPVAINEKILTPNNWQRWRLNGYFDWRPDAHNQIELTLNYTTQQLGGKQDTTADSGIGGFTSAANGYQHFLLPHLDWRSEWAKGLANDLQGTYLHGHLSVGDLSETQLAADSFEFNTYNNAAKSYHLWIRDHLSYAMTAGSWEIEPAVNLSYEHIDELQGGAGETVFTVGGYYSLPGGGVSTNTFIEQTKTNLFLVTPGIDISYKRALDIQGGAMIYPGSGTSTRNGKKVYPYAGVTLDLLRFKDAGGESSLKLFGSVVSRASPSYGGYALVDFDNGGYVGPNQGPGINSYALGGFTGTVTQQPGIIVNVPPVYWSWETGVRYVGLSGRLELSYAFEHRLFTGYGTAQYSGNGSIVAVIYPEFRASLHHLDIRVKVVDRTGISWRTGVNVTLLRSQADLEGSQAFETPHVGDVAPDPLSWTGGWVNRVQVRDFVAGLDLIYHINESEGAGFPKRNSVVMPNVYAGYRFHFGHGQVLEVFADGRGLVRNKKGDLMDIRKWYTLGGKFSI